MSDTALWPGWTRSEAERSEVSDTALCPWWKKRSGAKQFGRDLGAGGWDQGLGWCWGRGWAERSEAELGGYWRGVGVVGRGAKRSEAPQVAKRRLGVVSDSALCVT